MFNNLACHRYREPWHRTEIIGSWVDSAGGPMIRGQICRVNRQTWNLGSTESIE